MRARPGEMRLKTLMKKWISGTITHVKSNVNGHLCLISRKAAQIPGLRLYG